MVVEKIVGNGEEFVYCYYFPSERKGNSSWPIKIGKAKSDWRKRIGQQQASMKEEPVLCLLIKTPNSSFVESLIHISLKSFKMPSFGEEWFKTTPEAIENSIKFGLSELPLNLQFLAMRKSKGMTQSNLSEASDVRQATISSIENGDKDVLLSTLFAVATELKCKLVLEPYE